MSGTRFFLPGVKLTWSKRWLERTLEWTVDLSTWKKIRSHNWCWNPLIYGVFHVRMRTKFPPPT
jgi:hypothetical protein